MAATVILGGGFGGLSCARTLRALLPESHAVTLVDRAPGFLVGAAKSWVMTGERRPESIVRARAALLPPGVSLLQADVLALDPERRRVETTAGSLEADHLVIALGVDLEMDVVPGLGETARSFYTLVAAMRLHDALRELQEGRVAILVARTPIKCPPAPYEACFLLHAYFQGRGIRDRVQLELWTAEPTPVPTAGAELGRVLVEELERRGVVYRPGHRAVAADPQTLTVRFDNGTELSCDLLIAVPPHRVPRVAVQAGLAEPEGWIPVDPSTLEVRGGRAAPQIYAIGDAAGVPLPGRHEGGPALSLPKAGVFAAAQGEVVARRIAAAVRGEEPDAVFEGRGYCLIETGGGRAIRAGGEFFATPHPRVGAGPADEATYREKLAWAEHWLATP